MYKSVLPSGNEPPRSSLIRIKMFFVLRFEAGGDRLRVLSATTYENLHESIGLECRV